MAENINEEKIIFNAMKECGDLAEKLKAEGKNGDYILIYSKGYFQGEYDTKQKIKSELKEENNKLKSELETYKKIAEKLALRYADYLMDYEGRTGEKNHLIPTTAEKLLDLARKEVENGK